ncbi:histone H1.8-like [Lepus europaeus]|uniref:histone H1.8-like n=1 Tax=Lepus europaeus TaxID=9983 RepID=UPI002B4679E0|nr:histone H1.8-like [Lepus europaeus]
MQASASPSVRKGKSKIKGHGQSQGHSKAHGRTSAGSKSSKPTANKVKNGVASPSRKKTTTKAPRGVVPGMGARPKAKATTPSKGPGSKVGPVPLSGKSEGPRSPRKPGLPPKAPASKTSGKKAKAEGSGLGRQSALQHLAADLLHSSRFFPYTSSQMFLDQLSAGGSTSLPTTNGSSSGSNSSLVSSNSLRASHSHPVAIRSGTDTASIFGIIPDIISLD